LDIKNRIVGYDVVPLDDVLFNPKNWRVHPGAQQEALKGVLENVGYVQNVIINKTTGHLVDGHLRCQLAAREGQTTIPVTYVEITQEEEDLILASLDPIAAMASTDKQKLEELLKSVDSESESINKLLEDVADANRIELHDFGETPEPQFDKAEELRVKWGVETGQLWQLGEHRLICGDCTDKAVVDRVMGGERADLCLTDPPYGLGNKKKSGKNDYDQHEDSRENLIILAGKWLPIAREISIVVVFFPGITNAWIYPEANWMMCWFYAGGQLRSSWGFNCWQPILCYGKDPSLASGNGGRPDAVEMNTPANAGDIDHPCPKPIALWRWLIKRLSFNDNDIFYEPFCGSGTTIIAGEQLSRKCRAIEISPAYCAVTIQRWVDMTGGTPVLIDTRN
jgi:DNA modification methylase